MPKTLHWTPERVTKFWNVISGSQLDECGFSRVAGAQLFELISPHIPMQGRVVDYGAGAGHFSNVLLRAGYKVGVFEPSDDNLLDEVKGHANFSRVDLDADAGKYDIVFSLETIEHILEPDFDDYLSALHRLTKPGGLVVISTPNNEDLEHAMAYCVESDLFFHPWQHVRSLTPEGLVETMASAGFEKQFLCAADFSGNAEQFQEAELAKLRQADMLRVMSRIAESNNDKSAKEEADATTRYFAERHQMAMSGLLEDIVQPLSNHILEVMRRNQLTTLPEPSNDLVAKISEEAKVQVENHFNEFVRRVSEGEGGLEVMQWVEFEEVRRFLQEVTSSVGGNLGGAEYEEQCEARRKRDEELNSLVLLIDEKVQQFAERMNSEILPVLPKPSQIGTKATISASREMPALRDMSSEDIFHFIDAAYQELGSRVQVDNVQEELKVNTDGVDVFIGAGQTLVYVGVKR